MARGGVPLLLPFGQPPQSELRARVSGIEHERGGELALRVPLLPERKRGVPQHPVSVRAPRIRIERAGRHRLRVSEICVLQGRFRGVDQGLRIGRGGCGRAGGGDGGGRRGSTRRDRGRRHEALLEVRGPAPLRVGFGSAAELVEGFGEKPVDLRIRRALRLLQVVQRILGLTVGELLASGALQLASVVGGDRGGADDLVANGLCQAHEVRAVEVRDDLEVGTGQECELQTLSRRLRVARDEIGPAALECELRAALRRGRSVRRPRVLFSGLLKPARVERALGVGFEFAASACAWAGAAGEGAASREPLAKQKPRIAVSPAGRTSAARPYPGRRKRFRRREGVRIPPGARSEREESISFSLLLGSSGSAVNGVKPSRDRVTVCAPEGSGTFISPVRTP